MTIEDIHRRPGPPAILGVGFLWKVRYGVEEVKASMSQAEFRE
jgi:hypothetical protein